jgi:hypothetical protein
MSVRVALMFLAAVIGCSTPLATGHANEDEHGDTHEATHEYHPNMLGVFVGVTDEGREEAITMGVEYERRLNKSFGIGLFAEYIFGDADFWVYGVPFTYHIRQWTLYIGPGVEDGKHGSEYFTRIGGQYSFEAGSWEISPQMNLDLVDGNEVWVLGVVIGKGF